MKQGSKYSFNPFLLTFPNQEMEREYNKSFFKQDLYALRLVIILGVVLSLIFIFVDIFRYEQKMVSASFRGGMALILTLFGAATFLFKEKNYHLTQLIAMAVAVFVGLVFFLHYHFNDDPNFDIFLSNILMVLIFIISTIMGFRFRFALAINTLFVAAYILYIEYFNYSFIASRQISQLLVMYCVGGLSAYLLERQKLKLFISKLELNSEMDKVDSLNQIKDKLFSIISHDLRGPIVSLKGIVSLFNQSALTTDELKTLSKDLEKDLNNTSHLMDNLLAWSKSQLDGLELKKYKLKVEDIFENLLSLYQNQINTKALSIENNINEDAEVFGDSEMIQIAFRNLFSNAIKFTPHGGKIGINAHNYEKYCEIKISDNGVGIDAKKLNNLFQLDKMNLIGSSSASGAGIGLLLVKEFIDLNKGTIHCESSLGVGTSFKVRLPRV